MGKNGKCSLRKVLVPFTGSSPSFTCLPPVALSRRLFLWWSSWSQPRRYWELMRQPNCLRCEARLFSPERSERSHFYSQGPFISKQTATSDCFVYDWAADFSWDQTHSLSGTNDSSHKRFWLLDFSISEARILILTRTSAHTAHSPHAARSDCYSCMAASVGK